MFFKEPHSKCATPAIFIPSLLIKLSRGHGAGVLFSGLPRKRWIAVVVVLRKETVSRNMKSSITPWNASIGRKPLVCQG